MSEENNKVVMPRQLTAENGAKYVFSGEFYETFTTPCPECGGEIGSLGSPCDVCNDYGEITYKVPVSWTTIKEIYSLAVRLMGAGSND